jgi:hypothetical protein
LPKKLFLSKVQGRGGNDESRANDQRAFGDPFRSIKYSFEIFPKLMELSLQILQCGFMRGYGRGVCRGERGLLERNWDESRINWGDVLRGGAGGSMGGEEKR